MPGSGASEELFPSLPISASAQFIPEDLDRRIAALENNAGRLRADLLQRPALAQENLGVRTLFEGFGQCAVALMTEVVRQTSAVPPLSESRIEAQIDRIKVADHVVHVALHGIAALLPPDEDTAGCILMERSLC